MPIDKFLCNIDLPDFQPGPFAVRLKYEIKKLYFERRLSRAMHYVYSSAILGLFVLCMTLVLHPQTALRMNNYVFKNSDDALDMLLLPERDIDISNFPSNIRTVSADVNSLPFIEEDKSYLIHKFRNHENRTVIYVSEVKKAQQPSRYY